MVIFRQTRGLQRFPHRSGNHHDNINHTNIFGPREDSRKNRWTSARLVSLGELCAASCANEMFHLRFVHSFLIIGNQRLRHAHSIGHNSTSIELDLRERNQQQEQLGKDR